MSKIIHFFTFSIRRRMSFSFAIVILLVLTMTAANQVQLGQVKVTAGQVIPNSTQMGLLQDFALALASLDANMEGLFVVGGVQFQEDIVQNLDTMEQVVATIQANAEAASMPLLTELALETASLTTGVLALLEKESAELNSGGTNQQILKVYSQIDRVEQLHSDVSAETLGLLHDAVDTQQAMMSRTVSVLFVLAVATCVIIVLASFFVTRSIASPIAALARTATHIATGNLELEAKTGSGLEIDELAEAFNSMTGRLREMIHSEQIEREHLQDSIDTYVEHMAQVGRGNLGVRLDIHENGRGQDDPLLTLGNQLNETTAALQTMIDQIHGAATALNAQAAEILATTTQQASGATEQSAAITQASTTVDEIKTIAGQLVGRSRDVADAAQRTVEVSRAGQETVRETVEGMTQIKARVDIIEENILALSERTNQIGEIIDAVNDIASQSNMLALNAAVEAARAGEHGKGFSIVAQEVRDLAERSKRATAQVKTILSEIQRATNATGMATEEGKKGVDAGVQLVSQMGQVIDMLAQVIDESAQSAAQMVAGGQQQTSGMEQIVLAMSNINQVTVQSLASMRQAERSAQELNDLASSLTELVEQYQA